MIRSLLSTWPLFFGLMLIMIGNGIQLILIGLRSSAAGYSNLLTGIMMGGYFLGIFIGSIIVPKTLSQVGHIRTFGALAAIASSSVLLHVIFTNPVAWTILRTVTGFCYAGMYIIVESWLNEKATNETRGQILSIYMIITMGGLGAGQLISGFDNGVSINFFLLASVLVSLAVVPVLISVAKAPDFEAPELVSFRRLVQISPLALIGLFTHGMVTAMIFGIGAIYAKNIGLTTVQTSVFMASITAGTLCLQYPLGRLSDRFDRRLIILAICISAAVFAFCLNMLGKNEFFILLLFMAFYGGTSLTLYSLFIAHANDYLTPSQMVSTSSSLLMVNGIGAVIGAPLIAAAMDLFGNWAFFSVIGLIQLALAVFVGYRMSVRPAIPAQAQGPFIVLPDTSTATAASLNPETEWIDNSPEAKAELDPLEDNPYFPSEPR
ncbi:MFS transporter [Alphaproteobacteria bacterium]|nr:MFS transporter [Alphaproteobacteria bacterium]